MWERLLLLPPCLAVGVIHACLSHDPGTLLMIVRIDISYVVLLCLIVSTPPQAIRDASPQLEL